VCDCTPTNPWYCQLHSSAFHDHSLSPTLLEPASAALRMRTLDIFFSVHIECLSTVFLKHCHRWYLCSVLLVLCFPKITPALCWKCRTLYANHISMLQSEILVVAAQYAWLKLEFIFVDIGHTVFCFPSQTTFSLSPFLFCKTIHSSWRWSHFYSVLNKCI